MRDITCINCGSGFERISVLRDKKSTRICGVCQTTWLPDQDVEKTDYKMLYENEVEISKSLRTKLEEIRKNSFDQEQLFYFLQRERKAQEFTLSQLAVKVGVSRNAVWEAEKAQRKNINFDLITKILNTLGYEIKLQINKIHTLEE